MKLRFISVALAIAMMGIFTVGASAAPNTQKGGAAGVVAAVVQLIVDNKIKVNDTDVQVGLVNVDRSLNNLRALNNVLNNSPVLSQNDIDVTVYDVTDDITITVIGDDVMVTVADNEILNNVQINALTVYLEEVLSNNADFIDAIVGIGVLNGTDLIIFHN